MSAGPLYDYTLSPLTVYITRDPNNESIARLTMGVSNGTDQEIKCSWMIFVLQVGAGPGDLTAQPGRIATSSSRPDDWSFTRIEGSPGQFRATPIFPCTGLRAGESISFQLANIAVNGVLGSTRVEITELTDGRHEDRRFLNKDVSALRIDYFRAVPNSIRPGEQATLEWKTQSAASCTLNRAGDEPEDVAVTGSRQVSPAASANYTLNAYGEGRIQANAFISVIRVSILEFTGPTDRIPPGARTPLSWRTEFATRCELKANGRTVDAQAPIQADLTPYWVSPQRDPTTYVLLAYGTEGRPYQKQWTVFLQPRFRLSLRETWTDVVHHGPTHITTPASSLHDTRLFAPSLNMQLHVLDWQERKRILSRNSIFFYFLEPSPDGKRLFAASWRMIAMHDATPGSEYRQIWLRRFSESPQPGFAFHPDGSKVYFAIGKPRYGDGSRSSGLTADDESESAETDSPQQTELHQGLICSSTDDLSIQFTLPVGTNPGGVSISPDGNTICLVEMNSALLYLIDLATREISTISTGSFSETRIVSSVWSPDGTKIYATNCTPGTIWVVTVATKAVSRIDLGADVTAALLRLGPEIPGFEEGSNVLYALCAPDGTVAGISTATDQVLSRVSLGQLSNPAFAFAPDPELLRGGPAMAVAPDGKSIYVSNPPKNSIFIIDNGAQHLQTEMATREGVELDGTVFDYVVSPHTVYITRDPQNPSFARLDTGVTNNTGIDMECKWVSFIVIPGAGRGELTADPGSISASSSRPDDWSIAPIAGAPGQFRAVPIFPNTGLKAGDSVSFQLAGILVNGELGGTNFDIVEFVGEPRGRAFPLNKIRGDLNIDFFHSEPSDITPGATSKLSWKTVAAAKCVLSWPSGSEEVDLTGSKHVSPSDTTIYTLTAHGGFGPNVSAQRAVVVNKVVVVLDASPKTVGLDDPSMLTWTVLNAEADSCRLDPGDFQIPPNGEKLVTLDKTTTYTVSARGGTSNGHNAITISVARPKINFFRSTTPAKPGDPVTLSWDVQYAKSVSIDQGVGQVPTVGSVVVSNLNQTTYTLTCLGLDGPVTAQVVVPGNKVEIHYVTGICIAENPWACNNLFFGVEYACIWKTSHATSTRLIQVSDNREVATQSRQFKYYIWAPAYAPQKEYRLIAEGPAGPAVATVWLGWMV
jgi:DNA-binding beta-propeller fold protein YncE